jgi:hypothetical protein
MAERMTKLSSLRGRLSCEFGKSLNAPRRRLQRPARQLLRCDLDGPVVVAVVAVRVMEVSIHQVVGVVAVGHRLVAATRAMDMARLVAAAIMRRSAVGRVDGVDRQRVLVDVPHVRMMQMPVMQVIGVRIVLDGRMTAAGAVNVIVVGMLVACG